MIPGEILVAPTGEIEINAHRARITLDVANTGDRPIQVGSHFPFYETNSALDFDREAAFNFRLNIAAGTATRFEPGETKPVELIEIGGEKRVLGGNSRSANR